MNLKKISIIGLLACVCAPAIAQDDIDDFEYTDEFIEEVYDEEVLDTERAIAVRMTCDKIAARITELRDEIAATPELESELNVMLGRQRTQCAPKSRRRPVRNYGAAPVLDTAPEEIDVQMPAPEPEPTAEEIAAAHAQAEQQKIENLARGLCPDGAKPNKFGCCAGEKFQEVASMQYACCPKTGGGDCHEPYRK